VAKSQPFPVWGDFVFGALQYTLNAAKNLIKSIGVAGLPELGLITTKKSHRAFVVGVDNPALSMTLTMDLLAVLRAANPTMNLKVMPNENNNQNSTG